MYIASVLLYMLKGVTITEVKSDPEEPPPQPNNGSGEGMLMNNGSRHAPQGDVQKLQQQLQDIKEQVRITNYLYFLYSYSNLHIFCIYFLYTCVILPTLRLQQNFLRPK